MESQVLRLLPTGYQYKFSEIKDVVERDFSATFLCNLLTKNDALEWVKKFKEITEVEWRVWRTFPDSGRYNVYKIIYRCEHNSHRKLKENSPIKRSSKITGCVANFNLTIKRFVKKSKAQRPPSEEERSLPCEVILNNSHNHPRNTADCAETFYSYNINSYSPELELYWDSSGEAESVFNSTYSEFCETLDDLKKLLTDHPSQNTVLAMKKFIGNCRKHTTSIDSVRSALSLWGKFGVAKRKRKSDCPPTEIRVQPAPATVCGKTVLAKRQKPSTGSPTQNSIHYVNEHDYTILVHQPCIIEEV